MRLSSSAGDSRARATKAITTIQRGSFHLPVQNGKLLAKQGILGDERCFAVRQVGERTRHERLGVGTQACAEGFLKQMGE